MDWSVDIQNDFGVKCLIPNAKIGIKSQYLVNETLTSYKHKELKLITYL